MFDPEDPLSRKAKDDVEGNLHILLGLLMQDFYDWMVTEGKKPKKNEPMSESAAEGIIRRLDQIHRKVWQERGQDPVVVRPDHGSAFVDWLNEDEVRKQDGDPYDDGSKRKFLDALKKFATWRATVADDEAWANWESPVQFSQSDFDSADTFSLKEFGDLRDVAQTYRKYPEYEDASQEEREEINRELAQRLRKPISRITPGIGTTRETVRKFLH